MPVESYAAAFGIPYELGVWRDELTTGEAGPRPGVPEPQARTDGSYPLITVTPSGPQEAGTTMIVRYVSPGFPPDAGYVTKETADAVYQGRDTALLTMTADKLSIDLGPPPIDHVQPHGVSLPNGVRVVAYVAQASLGPRVHVLSRAPSATSWTDTAIGNPTDLPTGYGVWPALLVVGSALILAHWHADSVADQAQVDVWQSLDSGVTWTAYQKSVLPSVIDTTIYDLKRLRMGALRGQVLLMASGTKSDVVANPREYTWQYASSDRAGTFALLATLADVALPDVNVWDGRLFVAVADLTTQQTHCWVTGNAWTPLSSIPYDPTFFPSSTTVSITAHAVTKADHGLAVLEGGIYLIFRVPTGETVQIMRWSGSVSGRDISDLGVSAAASGNGVFWRQANAGSTDWPVSWTVFGWRGRIEMACNLTSFATTYDNQLFLLESGGNASIVAPFVLRFHGEPWMSCWDQTWIASSLPSVGGYPFTVHGAGATSITTTPGRMRLTTTANTKYYDYTVTTVPSLTTEIRLGVRLWQVSGGNLATGTIAVRLEINFITVGFIAEIDFTSTQARLHDIGGASTIATVAADIAGGAYVVIAVGATGLVTAGVAGPGDGSGRVYQVLAQGVQLTDTGGDGLNDATFTFGNLVAGTATSEWGFVGLAYDEAFATSVPLSAGQSNPSALNPIPAGLGYDSYLGHGLSARVKGGPAWVGDQINIPAAAAYGARNVLPAGWDGDELQNRGGLYPSPAVGYRSAIVGSPAAYRLPFRLPSRAEEYVVRGYSFCHLERYNFRLATFEGYTGAAWATIGSFDGSTAALAFQRSGAQIRPDASTSIYIRTNEYAGGYVYMRSTAMPTVTQYRRIKSNTSGYWNATGATSTIPVIELYAEDLDGTEPVAGTVRLVPTRATLIVPKAPTVSYAAYALSWSGSPASLDLYEGDFRIGKAVMGELWVIRSADWGVQRSRRANTDIQELENGRKTARKISNPRWVHDLPWTSVRPEGFLVDPTYTTWFTLTTGGKAVAMSGQEAELLEGIQDQLAGGKTCAVYIPQLDQNGGTQTLLGFQAGTYGRWSSERTTWNMEYGKENAAMVAGEKLTWEEEQ